MQSFARRQSAPDLPTRMEMDSEVMLNNYDLVYVTAFPKHAFLIGLLKYYGFAETEQLANGERLAGNGMSSHQRGAT